MNKMKSWKLLSFVLIVYLIQTAYTAGITQDGNAVVGASFTIVCVTDSVAGAIQITDPSGNLAANCLIPSGTTSICVPGTDPNYSASQDVATKTTNVTISVTDRAAHGGTWTCTKAGDTPITTSVTILTVPASITELTPAVTDFEVETSTSKTMTAVVECAYPSAQIDWEFVTETSASTGISPTRNTCTDMGLTGGSCSDAAAKTFRCDFTVTETSTASLSAGKYKLKANLYMDGEVTSTGISVELTPIITITASSSSSNCDLCTPTIALAVSGLFVAVVCVALCLKMYFKFRGQTINHVSVKNNDPLTLTCLAGDLATTPTWTGPGGILYVTGTTVQAGLSDTIKSRISASHTKGSYKLTFTEFRSSDKGTYTSKVNGTVVKHEVIVEESGGGKGKFECSVTWCFRETSIATVVSVIGFILCIAGLIICVTCDDSVSSSNSVTVGFALAVVGFVLAAVTLVIVIILVILFCCGVITIKDDGQIITHQVKSNDPLTLTHTANDMATTPTHPADDKATTLTWTGPGGTLYVTGTTVEDDLHHLVKSRISVRYTGGSYTLTFTEVLSSDMGIYTSTVNGTVVKHEVIVQDNKAVRARPDGQDAKPRTERTPRSAGSPTSASNIKTKWRNNQVSDSNESDGSNDTPRRKLEDVPQGRKLPALELVDASQKANTLEPLEVNETKKLKKKKKRRSKEEKAQVISGNSDNERSDTQDVLLPHQVSDMSPPSGTQLRGTVQTDHSITRQEPGHEEKEGKTVDSHTNNTHL